MSSRPADQILADRDWMPWPGLHSYHWQARGGKVRIHLRVAKNQEGLLLINANRALHLNPTATLMAWSILEGKPEKEIVRSLRRRFRVASKTARQDLKSIRYQLKELIDSHGPCPIHGLHLEILRPFSRMPQAPYRMDLALTYRCNCDCAHCYNARPRNYPELETDDWRRILDGLWEIGVPHICFTGGEATLRPDLPELISHAQSLGQITGLLTNGRRLSHPAYVEELVQAGLDHVQITLESHDQEIHDRMVRAGGAWKQTVKGIRNALETGLFLMTNTTLLEENSPSLGATIDFLAELGVPTIGCNALIYAGLGKEVGTGLPEESLEPTLRVARDRTERHGQRLIWYTPTQYCHFDPVQMELGVRACTAARFNMCVEPDGGVIPCQSYYRTVGNMLVDSWESIWNHEICQGLRRKDYLPEKCRPCPVLQECGGGCPLSLVHQQPLSQMAGCG